LSVEKLDVECKREFPGLITKFIETAVYLENHRFRRVCLDRYKRRQMKRPVHGERELAFLGQTRLLLLASCFKAEVLAEERYDVVLETIGYGAGVGAFVNLESVRDSVRVQDVVKLGSVGFESVLVAYVD
jgi:hypothetical protein